jgi:hypothetical protein
MNMITLAVIPVSCFCVLTAGCGSSVQPRNSSPSRNSVIAVIANPERYDRRQITAVGYVSMSQENCAVFLHEEDFRRAIYSNALWLNLSSADKTKYESFNEKYCLVEGIFRSGAFGFGGFYAGSVDVTWIGNYVDAASLRAE